VPAAIVSEPMGRYPDRQNRPHLCIAVVRGFRLDEEGVRVLLPEGSQPLLAFLALKGTIWSVIVAGTVRPTVLQDHASSSPDPHSPDWKEFGLGSTR
jgi:hypothetical protein